MLDLWWHTGPAIAWIDGRLVDMPVYNEPELGFTHIAALDERATPPLPQSMVAFADPHITCRYHVVTVGAPAPDHPGKRLFANCREPIHVPAGMQIAFSPE